MKNELMVLYKKRPSFVDKLSKIQEIDYEEYEG